MKINVFLILNSLFLITCTNQEVKKVPEQIKKREFITPAIKGVDVPFESSIFLAQDGDTLFYGSGSMVLFPKHAFVDENGGVVKGKVEVIFREFSDPIDYFMSGIPMEYDSAGLNFNFESSAMCEIKALPFEG